MSISDFISDVLCFPIFKLYIENYELLLHTNMHTFKKIYQYGEEMICLQPPLLKKVQLSKEEGIV